MRFQDIEFDEFAIFSKDGPVDRYLARFTTDAARNSAFWHLGAVMAIICSVPPGASRAELKPRSFPWWSLRARHTKLLGDELAQRYIPVSANAAITSLRGVLRECQKLRLMTESDCQAACGVRWVRSKRDRRRIDKDQLAAMFSACKSGREPIRFRDGAIVALVLECGFARSEAVRLSLADYDLQNRKVTRSSPSAELQVSARAHGWIADWLVWRGVEPGPLLCPVAPDGRIRMTHIRPISVLQRLVALARRVGIRERAIFREI
jgi:integrase